MSLKDIRSRIQSVKNTRQITKAMKMVAAAKLRKAQHAVADARPYAYALREIVEGLAQREDARHRAFEVRPVKSALLFIFSSDRGLCGGFNANLFRQVLAYQRKLRKDGIAVEMVALGRKAGEYFPARATVVQSFPAANKEKILAYFREATLDFLDGKRDRILVAFNEFQSAIVQKVRIRPLLPLGIPDSERKREETERIQREQFKKLLLEPAHVLDELVQTAVSTEIELCQRESAASEQGARMAAMENATKNASDLIDGLTLVYNKARQASITKELMEIVSGVEAMR